MQTVSDVGAALTATGAAPGRIDEALKILMALDARLDAKTRRAARAGRNPASFSGAGVVNVPSAAARYAQLPAEEIIRRAPDIIFDAAHDAGEHGLAVTADSRCRSGQRV